LKELEGVAVTWLYSRDILAIYSETLHHRPPGDTRVENLAGISGPQFPPNDHKQKNLIFYLFIQFQWEKLLIYQ